MATDSTDRSGNNRPLLRGRDDDYHPYRENCPGCRLDLLNRQHTSVPYLNFSFIWFVSLCTALPIQSLFPFIYFMIRDFHVTERDEDIGFYAGYVVSSPCAPNTLTSFLWGRLADRYGRKPVILIGTFSVAIFNALFGLSSSFWLAISMRFLLGCFNSLLGTIRAYATEVCREEHQSLALSIVSTSRGIRLIIRPAIGGFLLRPAEKYPSLFPENSIFARFPYFLPCLIISIYSLGVFIACWWLPETLHMHGKEASVKESTIIKGVVEEASAASGIPQKANLLKNWPLMSTIMVYCVFSLQEIAYSEVSHGFWGLKVETMYADDMFTHLTPFNHHMQILTLWAVSDKKYGGLSFSSQDVGEVLAISGTPHIYIYIYIYIYSKILCLIHRKEISQLTTIR
ncbi:Probable peptide/nitrate transporter At3g43790 [Linum grandiflorum]